MAGKQYNIRYNVIDNIRAFAIINMVLFHFLYDVVYFLGIDVPFFTGPLGRVWQILIGGTFLFLSGFCFALGKNQLKRGMEIFAVGLGVTIVTWMILPDIRILFGVMTCIGSCMIFTYFLDGYLAKFNEKLGFILFFILFLITLNISSGYLTFFNFKIALPDFLYQNYLTAYLGFPFKGFYSGDYYAMMPWLFIYLSGYYGFLICKKKGLLDYLVGKEHKVTRFISSHSLEIYIIHQPILYGLVLIINALI